MSSASFSVHMEPEEQMEVAVHTHTLSLGGGWVRIETESFSVSIHASLDQIRSMSEALRKACEAPQPPDSEELAS